MTKEDTHVDVPEWEEFGPDWLTGEHTNKKEKLRRELERMEARGIW